MTNEQNNKSNTFLVVTVEDFILVDTSSLSQKRKHNIMSHHFRSPLNSSIGILEICKKKLDKSIYDNYISRALSSNYILLNNLDSYLDM